MVHVDDATSSGSGTTGGPVAESSRSALRALGSSRPVCQGAQFEVETSQLRRFVPSPPPAGLHPDERWIDIRVGEQVAAAYQGTRPPFAAWFRTGGQGTTPLGSFFIYRKYLTQTMANLAEPLSSTTFARCRMPSSSTVIGSHAVLWHDKLGTWSATAA